MSQSLLALPIKGDGIKPLIVSTAILVLSGCLLYAVRLIFRRQNVTYAKLAENEKVSASLSVEMLDSAQAKNQDLFTYDHIEPDLNFDWETTKPLQFRPFKPKYNLTMSIEKKTISDLIAMDNTYIDRIHLRRQILAEHPDIVLGASPDTKDAVDEFYIWCMGTYLPKRYPRMFQIKENPENGAIELWNAALEEFTTLQPFPSQIDSLRLLGGTIDVDLQFLLPSKGGQGYELGALVTCFPNGFNMRNKLGLTLDRIHVPVPGYKEKLQLSLNRWVSKLAVGTIVQRVNWTITPHSELFTPMGNHLYEGEVAQAIEIDPEKTHVRCERQFVHRLPISKAVLFSFKTYLYPITDIKDEGLGETLAEAIGGLKSGNVPGMHFSFHTHIVMDWVSA